SRRHPPAAVCRPRPSSDLSSQQRHSPQGQQTGPDRLAPGGLAQSFRGGGIDPAGCHHRGVAMSGTASKKTPEAKVLSLAQLLQQQPASAPPCLVEPGLLPPQGILFV